MTGLGFAVAGAWTVDQSPVWSWSVRTDACQLFSSLVVYARFVGPDSPPEYAHLGCVAGRRQVCRTDAVPIALASGLFVGLPLVIAVDGHRTAESDDQGQEGQGGRQDDGMVRAPIFVEGVPPAEKRPPGSRTR